MKEQLTENQLASVAEYHPNQEISSEAMKQLKEKFDPTYMWCSDCDFAVVIEKDCCLNQESKDVKI